MKKSELPFRVFLLVGVVLVLMAGISIGLKMGTGNDFLMSLNPGTLILFGGLAIIAMALRGRK